MRPKEERAQALDNRKQEEKQENKKENINNEGFIGMFKDQKS